MLSQVVQCTSDSVGAELRFLVKLHLLPRSVEKRSQNSSTIVNIAYRTTLLIDQVITLMEATSGNTFVQ